MDVFTAINKRYCFRGEYNDTEVSENDLRKIVQAGLDAPTGKNAQTTEFIIVNDRKIIDKIKEIMPPVKVIQTAKAMIFLLIDLKPEAIYDKYSFQIEDCSAATENMFLAITALGYSSVWMDGILRLDERAEKIGELLKMPKDKIIRIMLPVGVEKEEGPRKEKLPFTERAWFNGYKNC